jgi:hypothetical protein
MNQINPDGKLTFFKAAKVMELDDETRDRGWRMLNDLGLSPDDPLAIALVVTVLLGKVATVVPAALNALPLQIAEVTNQTSGQIASGVSTRLQRSDFSKKIGRAVARSAAAYFHSAQNLQRLRVSSVLVFATVAVIFLSLLTGIYLGSADAERLASHWTELAARPDGSAWLHIAQMNGNLTGALATCETTGPNAFLVHGARACNVPLWLDEAPIPEVTVFGQSARLQSLLSSVSSAEIYFALSGFILGTIGRKLIKMTVSLRPIRWIFDAE